MYHFRKRVFPNTGMIFSGPWATAQQSQVSSWWLVNDMLILCKRMCLSAFSKPLHPRKSACIFGRRGVPLYGVGWVLPAGGACQGHLRSSLKPINSLRKTRAALKESPRCVLDTSHQLSFAGFWNLWGSGIRMPSGKLLPRIEHSTCLQGKAKEKGLGRKTDSLPLAQCLKLI